MVLEQIKAMPYGDLIFAGIIIIASVVFSQAFMIFLGRVVLHVTAKTKTTLDDAILRAIRRPLYIAIILGGIFLAIDSLNYVDPYLDTIKAGFTVVWVLLAAYTVSRIIKEFFDWYAKEIVAKTKTKLDETFMPIIRKMLNFFIYAIALIIILKSFGVEITPLIAGLGIGGLAVALALQDTLSNLFSGTFMVSDKIIKVGDYIEIEGGPKGYVEEIGWRTTKIKTLPNNLVIVPNAKLANSIITDYSAPQDEMAVVIQVGVAYDSDLDKTEKVTIETARQIQKTVTGAIKNFEPFIRYHTFGDSNINFSVILRVEKFVDQYLVTHEFVKALKKRYDKEGIEISFPVRKIVQAK
ncbi:MAG: mechanosensitive ion channel family protein [Candidatus Aenigmarchaeota archaeon]|nr:mechanosensitive ion channel family protein [Candidatus Aenigmarchaeota archaeon]